MPGISLVPGRAPLAKSAPHFPDRLENLSRLLLRLARDLRHEHHRDMQREAATNGRDAVLDYALHDINFVISGLRGTINVAVLIFVDGVLSHFFYQTVVCER